MSQFSIQTLLSFQAYVALCRAPPQSVQTAGGHGVLTQKARVAAASQHRSQLQALSRCRSSCVQQQPVHETSQTALAGTTLVGGCVSVRHTLPASLITRTVHRAASQCSLGSSRQLTLAIAAAKPLLHLPNTPCLTSSTAQLPAARALCKLNLPPAGGTGLQHAALQPCEQRRAPVMRAAAGAPGARRQARQQAVVRAPKRVRCPTGGAVRHTSPVSACQPHHSASPPVHRAHHAACQVPSRAPAAVTPQRIQRRMGSVARCTTHPCVGSPGAAALRCRTGSARTGPRSRPRAPR